MMSLPRIHRILATTALCLAAGINSCRFFTVEHDKPAVAHIYDGGSIAKQITFTGEQPHPEELRSWIDFNNGKLYRATLAYWVPNVTLCFPDQPGHFSFYTKYVQAGSHIRRSTDEDKAFLNWLNTQAGVRRCPECNGGYSDCLHCRGRGVVPVP